MDHRDGMTLNIGPPPSPFLSAPEPNSCLSTHSISWNKNESGFESRRGKGELVQYWMFGGGLGRIHGPEPVKKKKKKRILSQDRKIEIDSTRMSFLTSVQEQAKDMVWFSDALSVPERMSCTCLLTSERQMGPRL